MADSNNYTQSGITHLTARQNQKSGMYSAFRSAPGGQIVAPSTSYSSTGSAGGTDWISTVRTETVAAINLVDSSANTNLIKASEFTTDYMTAASRIFYKIGDDGWYYKWQNNDWKKIYCSDHDTYCNKIYRQIWMTEACGFSWNHDTVRTSVERDCELIGSDDVRKRVIRKIEQEAYPCEIRREAIQFDVFRSQKGSGKIGKFEWIEYVDINRGFDLSVPCTHDITFEADCIGISESVVMTTIGNAGISVSAMSSVGTFLMKVTGNYGFYCAANSRLQISGSGAAGGAEHIRFTDDVHDGPRMERIAVPGGAYSVFSGISSSDVLEGFKTAEKNGENVWLGPITAESSAGKKLRVYRFRLWKTDANGIRVIIRDLRPVRRIYDGQCGLYDVCTCQFYFNPDNPIIMSELPAIDKQIGSPVNRYIDLDTEDDLAGVIALLDKNDLDWRVDGLPSHNGVDKPEYDDWFQMVLMPNFYIGTADVPEGAYMPERSEVWISDKWLPGMIPWFCNEPEPGKMEPAGDWKLMARYPMAPAHQYWREWQGGENWAYQGDRFNLTYADSSLMPTWVNFMGLYPAVITKGAAMVPVTGKQDWVDGSVDVSYYGNIPYFIYPSDMSYMAFMNKVYLRTWWEDTVLGWLHTEYWGTLRSERVVKGVYELKTGGNVSGNPWLSSVSVPDGSFDSICPLHRESVLGYENPEPTGIAIERDNPFWYGSYEKNEPWSFMWMENPKGLYTSPTPGINMDVTTLRDSSRAAKMRVFRNYHNRSTDYMAPDGFLEIQGREMSVFGAFGADRITGGSGIENTLQLDAPECQIWTPSTASFTDWIGFFGADYYKPITATDGTQTSSYYTNTAAQFHVSDVTRWGIPMGFDGESKCRSHNRNSGIGFHSLVANYRSLWDTNLNTYVYGENSENTRKSYSYTYFAGRNTGWYVSDGNRFKSQNWIMSSWVQVNIPSFGTAYSNLPGHVTVNVRGDVAKFVREHTLYRKPKGHSAVIFPLDSSERAAWAADSSCFGIRWNEAVDLTHGVPSFPAVSDVSVIGSQKAYSLFRRMCEDGGRACEIRMADIDVSKAAGAYTYRIDRTDVDYLEPGYSAKWLTLDTKTCDRTLWYNDTTWFTSYNIPFDPYNPEYQVIGDFSDNNISRIYFYLTVNPMTVTSLTKEDGAVYNQITESGATTSGYVNISNVRNSGKAYKKFTDSLWTYTDSVSAENLIKYKYIHIFIRTSTSGIPPKFKWLRLQQLVPSYNSVTVRGWNDWQQMTEVPNMQVGLAQNGDEKEDYREVWFCIDPVRTPEGMTPWFIEEDNFGNIVSSGASKLVSRYKTYKEPNANMSSALPGFFPVQNGATSPGMDTHPVQDLEYCRVPVTAFNVNGTSASSVHTSTLQGWLADTGDKTQIYRYRPRLISCAGMRGIQPLLQSGEVNRQLDWYPASGMVHAHLSNLYTATWWEELVMKYAMTSYFGNLAMNNQMRGWPGVLYGSNLDINSTQNGFTGSITFPSIIGNMGWSTTASTYLASAAGRLQSGWYSFRGEMWIAGMTDASVYNRESGIIAIPNGEFRGTGVFLGLEAPLNTLAGDIPSGMAVRTLGAPSKEVVIADTDSGLSINGNQAINYRRIKIEPEKSYDTTFRIWCNEGSSAAGTVMNFSGKELIDGTWVDDAEITAINTGTAYSVRHSGSVAYLTLGANTANRIMPARTPKEHADWMARATRNQADVRDITKSDVSAFGSSDQISRFWWNGPNYDIESHFNGGRRVSAMISNMNLFGLPLNHEYLYDFYHTKYGTGWSYVSRMREWTYPCTDMQLNSYCYGNSTKTLDYSGYKMSSNSPLATSNSIVASTLYPIDTVRHMYDKANVWSVMWTTEYGQLSGAYRLTVGLGGLPGGPKSRKNPNLLLGTSHPWQKSYYHGVFASWPANASDSGFIAESGGDALLEFRRYRFEDLPILDDGNSRGEAFLLYKNTAGKNRDAAQNISKRINAGDTLTFSVWYRTASDSSVASPTCYLRIENSSTSVARAADFTASSTWQKKTWDIGEIPASAFNGGNILMEMGITGLGSVEYYMPYLRKGTSADDPGRDWAPAVEDRYRRDPVNTLDKTTSRDMSDWSAGTNWITSGTGSSVTRERVYDLPGVNYCWRIKTGSNGDCVQISKTLSLPSPFAHKGTTFYSTYYTLGFWVKGLIPASGINIIKVQRAPRTTVQVWPRMPNQGKSVIADGLGCMVPANMSDTVALNTDVTAPSAAYEITEWTRFAVTLKYLPAASGSENNNTNQGSITTDQSIGIYIGKTFQNSAHANCDIMIAGVTLTDGLMDGGVECLGTDLLSKGQYGPVVYEDF